MEVQHRDKHNSTKRLVMPTEWYWGGMWPNDADCEPLTSPAPRYMNNMHMSYVLNFNKCTYGQLQLQHDAKLITMGRWWLKVYSFSELSHAVRDSFLELLKVHSVLDLFGVVRIQGEVTQVHLVRDVAGKSTLESFAVKTKSPNYL